MPRPVGLRKGPIGEAERQALHDNLDQLIDLRNIVEAGGRQFRSVPWPLERSVTSPPMRVDKRLPDQYLLHQHALQLAASLAGEDVLLTFQPGVDPRAVSTKSGIGLGLVQYGAILPSNQRTIAKHKLIGLMWQQAELAVDTSKKRAKGKVGDVYKLSADAVSKWEKGCRRLLGACYVDAALSKALELEPAGYYAAVFGAEHGSKSLVQCAAAYKLSKRAAGVSDKRGKRKNIA